MLLSLLILLSVWGEPKEKKGLRNPYYIYPCHLRPRYFSVLGFNRTFFQFLHFTKDYCQFQWFFLLVADNYIHKYRHTSKRNYKI